MPRGGRRHGGGAQRCARPREWGLGTDGRRDATLDPASAELVYALVEQDRFVGYAAREVTSSVGWRSSNVEQRRPRSCSLVHPTCAMWGASTSNFCHSERDLKFRLDALPNRRAPARLPSGSAMSRPPRPAATVATRALRAGRAARALPPVQPRRRPRCARAERRGGVHLLPRSCLASPDSIRLPSAYLPLSRAVAAEGAWTRR